MQTLLTSKGQVTIPKKIRDALGLMPGNAVEFGLDRDGEVVIRKAGVGRNRGRADRFEAARGKADVKWRTDELMALLRGQE
ncbi:MAG: AbrB/MazE/SpoVT family DNA-binding domain-containing protein [Rhodocyclaceae bacterium]|nr:AbrB/MazE/SpoVT family DNA-binding domain-containing protein [Rhodocyclaceae bacterium]